MITGADTYEDAQTVRRKLTQFANGSFGSRPWSFKQKDSGPDPVSTEDTSDLIIVRNTRIKIKSRVLDPCMKEMSLLHVGGRSAHADISSQAHYKQTLSQAQTTTCGVVLFQLPTANNTSLSICEHQTWDQVTGHFLPPRASQVERIWEALTERKNHIVKSIKTRLRIFLKLITRISWKLKPLESYHFHPITHWRFIRITLLP